MIALDTNILARFYVDDPHDPESAKQRFIAWRILADSPALFAPLTVVLELEWVLRAFYGFCPEDFTRVLERLLGLPNVNDFSDGGVVLRASRIMYPSDLRLKENVRSVEMALDKVNRLRGITFSWNELAQLRHSPCDFCPILGN
jgi:hypothetical protein